MANPFRIALSDPHLASRPRYLVGGQAGAASGDVKLYEWHRSKREMAMIGMQADVGQIRALAWSPSITHQHLVATGLSTGRTLILSLSPSSLSPTLPLAKLSPVLNVKHSRPVTSLSFSTLDPNYLATGLERHRSDYSLLIWDVSAAVNFTPADTSSSWQRPLDRLEPTHSLGRDTGEIRNIQHYCPAEHIHSVAFIPETINELLASSNNKTIRLYDLRAPGPTGNSTSKDSGSASAAVMQWSTRAVYGIAPDSSHRHLFASWESLPGGSVVRLWDKRRLTGELLSFEVGSGGVLGLEWLGDDRLGVGTSEGVSVWEVVHGQREGEERTTLEAMRSVVRTRQTMQSFAIDKKNGEVLFVVKDGTIGVEPITWASVLTSGVRGDVTICSTELRTFHPNTGSPEGKRSRQDSNNDDLAHDSSSQSSDVESIRTNRFQLPPTRLSDLVNESRASRSRSLSRTAPSSQHKDGKPHISGPVGEDGEWREDGMDFGPDGLRKVLRDDVLYIMRRRAEEGYGVVNLELNAEIAARYPGHDRLAGIWEFIDHLTQVMDPTTSKARGYDLTFEGMYNIWTGTSNPYNSSSPNASIQSESTLSELPPVQPASTRGTITQGSAAWTLLRAYQSPQSPIPSTCIDKTGSLAETVDPSYAAVIQAINSRRTDLSHPGAPGRQRLPLSEREGARRMILAICGEKDDRAGEIDRLIEDAQRSKAASWAYFAGDEEQAVKILMSSESSRHRLLAATIAGFLSQSRLTRASELFDTLWRGMVNRIDDPYVRIMLSRIGGEGWESVLRDEAVPFLDRVAIATCNLDDGEFSGFLKERSERFLGNLSPSLHGLALTGLTASGLKLIQRWLERTGDIQTAALLSTFLPSSRLSTSENLVVKRWREGYRDLLDRWGMWNERAKYDVVWLEMGRALGEQRGDTPGEVCPACNGVLDRIGKDTVERKKGIDMRMTSRTNNRTSLCMLCNQPLPRCVICLNRVEPINKDTAAGQNRQAGDTYICCMTCRHGGHTRHILDWFQGGLDGGPAHEVCPVAGCRCECANI